MRQRREEEGRISEDGHGLGTVTPEMVEQRARELAVINGRSPDQVFDADVEEARRELTGEEHLVPPPSAAELVEEEDRWNPVRGSEGHEVPPIQAQDPQRVLENLVQEGVEDAEHEQMLEANRASLRRDREEGEG